MLHVAFLWHMHQPSYRDPVTGEVLLPWVRLHGVKDYSDMATVLELTGAAEPRMTVNWVPGLLDQIDAMRQPEYGRRERFWRLSTRPAEELSASEIDVIRQHFFSLPHETMLEPYERYRELRDKVRATDRLDPAELSDLQVWFNLAWCGLHARQHPTVQALLARGRGFSDADKQALLEAQREVVLGLVARWRALSDQGRVELSASPYYHPILPLLCDTEQARAADPSTPLPVLRFRWKADADAHIRLALDAHRRHFGQAPRGMWPSEGSVSAEILPLMRSARVSWLVTDEAILWKTLGGRAYPGAPGAGGATNRPTDKYHPWTLDGVTLFFRDHGLSDKIGFVYARWPRQRAYADFVQSLVAIRRLTEPEGDAVVVIALDGENCWEHYPGGITEFLPGLLDAIAETPGLTLGTLSEVQAAVPARPLPGLGTGSWIDGTFRTWLGDPVKNKAWDLLAETRQAVKRPMSELLASDPGLADLVMRSEASDWWWWFGEGHSTAFDGEFDALFRDHLKAIWLALGETPPEELKSSVYDLAASGLAPGPQPQRVKAPMNQLDIALDGSASWYFKWLGAGEILQSYGAIHRAESLLSRVLYGNDDEALYLRLDARERCREALANAKVELGVHGREGPRAIQLWPAGPECESACDEVLEARVPLSALGLERLPGHIRGHIALLTEDGDPLERFPGMGDLELELLSAVDSALNVGV